MYVCKLQLFQSPEFLTSINQVLLYTVFNSEMAFKPFKGLFDKEATTARN